MIRVNIVGASRARARELAEFVAQLERVQVIRAGAADEVLHRSSGGSDVTLAVGLTAEELRIIREPVVALGSGMSPGSAGGWIRALLPLEAPLEMLEAALLAAAAGLFVSTSGQSRAANDPNDDAVIVEPLTPRELEVLRALADGFANREIADRLKISEHTVKFHVSQILAKLNAESRAEAVATGIRRGLIPL